MSPEKRDAIDTALNVPALVQAGEAAIIEAVSECCSLDHETPWPPVRAAVLRVIERAKGIP